MRYRLRTLLPYLAFGTFVFVILAALQIKAIQVAKESAEFERARDAAEGP